MSRKCGGALTCLCEGRSSMHGRAPPLSAIGYQLLPKANSCEPRAVSPTYQRVVTELPYLPHVLEVSCQSVHRPRPRRVPPAGIGASTGASVSASSGSWSWCCVAQSAISHLLDRAAQRTFPEQSRGHRRRRHRLAVSRTQPAFDLDQHLRREYGNSTQPVYVLHERRPGRGESIGAAGRGRAALDRSAAEWNGEPSVDAWAAGGVGAHPGGQRAARHGAAATARRRQSARAPDCSGCCRCPGPRCSSWRR